MSRPKPYDLVTIDAAIAFLTEARTRLGGDACLILSQYNSELEDMNVNGLREVTDHGSRYVEVIVCGDPSCDQGDTWSKLKTR